MKPSKGTEFKVRHLIVPLDGSRLAEAALPITRQLAQKLGCPGDPGPSDRTSPPAAASMANITFPIQKRQSVI